MKKQVEYPKPINPHEEILDAAIAAEHALAELERCYPENCTGHTIKAREKLRKVLTKIGVFQ